jgi:hypothetical protein
MGCCLDIHIEKRCVGCFITRARGLVRWNPVHELIDLDGRSALEREEPMNRRSAILIASAAMLAIPAAARAHQREATKELLAANARVHDAVSTIPTGDLDVDFMMSLIAQYRGSLDLAQVALKYSKDPRIRELAAQTVEISEGQLNVMLEWIETDGGRL